MTQAVAVNGLGCPSGLEPPASGAVIDPAPFVRAANGLERLELAIFGAKCAGCIGKIEGGLSAMPGMRLVRLNLSTGKLIVEWEHGAIRPVRIVERLNALGYRAAAYDPEIVEKETDADGRLLLRSLAVAGFAAANIMLLSIAVWAGSGEMGSATQKLMHWVSAIIAIPASLYAGRPFFTSALTALKARRANMDVPISLAVILALIVSFVEFINGGEQVYFDAAVMLLFFLLIGRYLDHRLRLRARVAARDLLALQATAVSRLRADGAIETVAARDVAPGDLVLLMPGDRAPVDGVIVEGDTNIDQALVTGESAPIRAGEGATLHAGVLNLASRIVMRAEKPADQSLLADLARLIEAGEQSKSRYVRLADRAAALYVPVVHTLAILTFSVWFFALDGGLRASVLNAAAVLIITCPCALGLAAPVVQVVATGRLFQAGVLVKAGDALERLAEADTIVFDKTGTLTRGEMALVNRDAIDPRALEHAAQLARVSRHPLSRAIANAAGTGAAARDVIEVSGCGLEGEIDGALARLGRASWVGAEGEDGNETACWLKVGNAPPVQFVFDDQLREDAFATVGQLRAREFRVVMLSGDAWAPAERMSAAAGIDDYVAEISPVEKTAYLDRLKSEGRFVAMVGDGLNDAPSLAHAHASLTPASAADASQAAADFVYQGAKLAPIIDAVDVARAARRRVLENFAFAAIYNVCAVPLAALGLVTPLIAAAAMSGSSIVVTLNALRLAGRRDQTL